MTTDELIGFAYGEHLEGIHQRSLGYRLLAPLEADAWCAEVESLARRLQTAPYPDHWPPRDLFCSVLLGDGRRLLAVARYGLADHTPSHRRGGLELIGVVAPANLEVPIALSVYRWLQQRRTDTDDLRSLGKRFSLSDILAAVPPVAPPADPAPVLPIRLWQEGTLLFAATAPGDPDLRLGLLQQGASGAWQWLPLVGGDFPLQDYAQRGPLVAWTPHLTGVAVRLERKQPEELGRARPTLLSILVAALVVLLSVVNLGYMLRLRAEIHEANQAAKEATPLQAANEKVEESAERFARALDRLFQRQGGAAEWTKSQVNERYERLAAQDPNLKVVSPEGKEIVIAIHALSRRSAERMESLVRKALLGKGYDPKLIDLACQEVRAELRKSDE